eukprot:TRINITY_DN7546_c0_g1_i1.p1 TRINITY_DN7546_c0_g1~~TRINITY_DN7546_c0_g1_i1.p1  ORF type:complete len:568 (+),score=87.95 TRINITY_DN7546_c0_g1_i1:49-1752(+)
MALHLTSLGWQELEQFLAKQQGELKHFLLEHWDCHEAKGAARPSPGDISSEDHYLPVLLTSSAANVHREGSDKSCDINKMHQECSDESCDIRNTLVETDPSQARTAQESRWDWEQHQRELQRMTLCSPRSRKTGGRRATESCRLSWWQRVQLATKRVVITRHFTLTSAAMIVASGVLIAVQVQHCAKHLGEPVPLPVQLLQHMLNLLFLIELGLRWVAASGEFFSAPGEKNWNRFDLLCVCNSLLDFAMTDLMSVSDNSFLLSIMQLLRFLKVVRVFRLIRHLSELRAMILTVTRTLSALWWSIVLMVLIMGAFSTALTQGATEKLLSIQTQHGTLPLETDTEALQEYLGSLPRTIYTLFMSVTGGVSWEDLGGILLDMHWTYFTLFLFFLVFWLFAFMNVLNGFFVQSAFATLQQDRDELIEQQLQDRDKYITDLRNIFSDMDACESGEITCGELEEHLEDEKLLLYFSALELNINKAWDIFKLLDEDRRGIVSVEAFVHGCLRLRGTATHIDIALLAHDLQMLSRTLVEFMQFVDQSFQRIPGHDIILQPGSESTTDCADRLQCL